MAAWCISRCTSQVPVCYKYPSTIVLFLTRTQSGTPVEISLCYFDNFNHPQGDWPISFRMKRVITITDILIGLTQCGFTVNF